MHVQEIESCVTATVKMAALSVLVCIFLFAKATSVSITSPSQASPEEHNIQVTHSYGLEEESMINVHVVPHSHDDVGWVKTVDQYYSGTNSSIEYASVQFILDTVVEELWKDSRRRFIYVEMFYFERWWVDQDEPTRDKVRTLVKERRLEFANGGWSMNDEGCTHYNAIIDQLSLGLRFITREFGPAARPLVGWHIDTFGHSSGQAAIFSQMGYQGLFLYRIDYQDDHIRSNVSMPRRTEMIWRGSPSNLGPQSDIFTGLLYSKYNYHNPPGFCFDYTRCSLEENPDPVVDNKKQFNYNLDQKLALFAKTAKEQALHYRTNDIMFTMGQDFTYSNAGTWFKSLDKIVLHLNQNKSYGVRAFYSTPSQYMMAKHSANLTWSLKLDDFMPYADTAGGYWSGYYSSRPALKGYIRALNSFLQVCRQFEVWAGGVAKEGDSDLLARAMAIAQHHDAITGTETQHVANDYAMRLHMGQKRCEAVIANSLQLLTSSKKAESIVQPSWHYCEYLNISICPQSEIGSFDLVVYNPLARNRTVFISIPVSDRASVFGPDGSHVDSVLYPVSNATQAVRGYRGSAKYALCFTVPQVPPLGFAMFFIRPASKSEGDQFINCFIPKHTDTSNFVLKNKHLALEFNGTSGRVMRLTNLSSNVSVSLDQQFLSYFSYGSGPYVFLPSAAPLAPENEGNVAKIEILGAKHPQNVQEVRQVFSKAVSQVIRLYPDEKFVEFEYTIGPISPGREYITRFSSSLQSNATWWTDSNGREMRKRVRNHRDSWKLQVTDPISGNYYPVSNKIFIRDEEKGVQFTVLTDRSNGGSSLQDGDIELMLHRRLDTGDKRGIDEVLNEPGQFGDGLIVRGRQWVVFDSIANSAVIHRPLAEEMLLRPTLFFSTNSANPAELKDNLTTLSSAVRRSLPLNVHLLTLQQLDRRTILLRLEHQFEQGEDAKMSQPVSVDLGSLFKPFKILSLVELGLGGNVLESDIEKEHLKWSIDSAVIDADVNTDAFSPNTKPLDSTGDSSGIVTLSAMSIRTFNVTIL